MTLKGLNAGDRGMAVIENKTFDEIEVGQSAQLQRTLTMDDIRLFGLLSGDANPTHFGDGTGTAPQRVIGHGMWGASLVSALLGNQLPGAGTLYRRQSFEFLTTVVVGDTLTVIITVTALHPADKTVTFDCKAVNQRGEPVYTGEAEVFAPPTKQRLEHGGSLYAQF